MENIEHELLNRYFKIVDCNPLETLENVIYLSRKKTFGEIGQPIEINDENPKTFPHNTRGLFRGQNIDNPLNPTSYRHVMNWGRYDLAYHYGDFYHHNYKFHQFCILCEKQIPEFPKELISRLMIAQHYGVTTPLLDWTKNIWVAIYFSLNIKLDNDFKNFNDTYIYHIPDERALMPKENISNIYKNREVVYLEPFPIDKRIERQYSCFTFHPLPWYIEESKMPIVNRYKVSAKALNELWSMMDSIGICREQLFPDYEGIARKVREDFV